MIKAVNENTGDSFDLLGKGKKVLVLDDSKTLRNLVKMILEEYEYQIETASNGRDAIEKSNKWHPDLMICDINLTGSTLTGIDVLAQVKSHRKDLKVVMLSSKADKQTIDLCMEHGASAFIRKPFNNDDLVKRVSQILKSKDK
jgi:CheY-like chemotaxis protein